MPFVAVDFFVRSGFPSGVFHRPEELALNIFFSTDPLVIKFLAFLCLKKPSPIFVKDAYVLYTMSVFLFFPHSPLICIVSHEKSAVIIILVSLTCLLLLRASLYYLFGEI